MLGGKHCPSRGNLPLCGEHLAPRDCWPIGFFSRASAPLLVRVQQVLREAMGVAGLERMEREHDGSGPVRLAGRAKKTRRGPPLPGPRRV